MSANAVAWLTDFALKMPAFTFANFQRDFGRVKNGAGSNGKEGVKSKDGKPALRAWVPDYMRHTAISIHFAFHKHEGETASWAGNSPNVIHRHYKALVKEADAKDFWEITPDKVGQIIPIPTSAATAAVQYLLHSHDHQRARKRSQGYSGHARRRCLSRSLTPHERQVRHLRRPARHHRGRLD